MSTVQLGRGAWSCAHARSAHRGAEPNAEPFPSRSGRAGSQGCSLPGTAAGPLPADVCVSPPLLRFVIPCISLIRQRPSWSPRANAALAPHRPERPGTGGIHASRLTPLRARGALVSCTPHLQCEAARRGEEGQGCVGCWRVAGPRLLLRGTGLPSAVLQNIRHRPAPLPAPTWTPTPTASGEIQSCVAALPPAELSLFWGVGGLAAGVHIATGRGAGAPGTSPCCVPWPAELMHHSVSSQRGIAIWPGLLFLCYQNQEIRAGQKLGSLGLWSSSGCWPLVPAGSWGLGPAPGSCTWVEDPYLLVTATEQVAPSSMGNGGSDAAGIHAFSPC